MKYIKILLNRLHLIEQSLYSLYLPLQNNTLYMKRLLLILTAPCYLVTHAQQQDSIVNQKINEVVITTSNAKKGFTSKMPITFIENPQSYDVIRQETMKQQVSTTLRDALLNTPGLVRMAEATGIGSTGGEYYSMRGFAFQPNLLNGMASYNNAVIDLANIEQIEVVKGPNGTLYGGSVVSYGGLINVITKKPYDTLGAEANYTTGSNDLHRASIDFNTPIAKNLFFRLNTAYHKQHSFKDAGYSESFFVAPSIQYNVSEKVKLFFDLQYNAIESANIPNFFFYTGAPLTYKNLDLFTANRDRSFTSNDITIKNPTLNIQGRVEYTIAPNWVSNTIISKNTTRSNGYDQFLQEHVATPSFTTQPPSLIYRPKHAALQRQNVEQSFYGEFIRYNAIVDSKTDIINIQHNLTGQYKVGAFDNKFVWGLDYLYKNFDNKDSDYIDNGVISLVNKTDSGTLTANYIEDALKDSARMNQSIQTQTFSTYVSNVTNFLPNLSLMMSLRMDILEGKNSAIVNQKTHKTSFSPKFGLVYQPIQNKVAVFANYLNGFLFLDPAIISDPDGTNLTLKPFDPEQANQFEIGTKVNLLEGKLTASMSYYHIKVHNKLMTDIQNPRNFVQGGKVKSEGVEFSLTGTPITGWNIITGFSFNNNKVTKSRVEDDNIGLRPEEAGPPKTFNLWTNYQFQKGMLKHLSIGAGINAVSSHKIMNRHVLGALEIPSYAVVQASASYIWKKVTLTLKVDNLTNEKYFTGWSFPVTQGYRNLSLSLNYRL